KLIEPVGQARNDFDIFCALSDRLGCRAAFDEGRDADGWLRHLWAGRRAQAASVGVKAPGFDSLFASGPWPVPPLPNPEVLLESFRADPLAHALSTPSGRIEITSTTMAGFGLADCPAHATWLPPDEWLGGAAPDELHLITNQPARQLHSQLWQVMADGPQPVHMHPDDATDRGLQDGAVVRLHNDRGACLARLVRDAGVRRGVVVMHTGAWF